MENLIENGTDEAVIAIQEYFQDGQLDNEWFTDNIELVISNTKTLSDDSRNNRIKPYSVAYSAMLELFRMNNHNLSSRQVQAGFRKLGLDYKEILKPVIDYVIELRNNEGEEMVTEDVNEYKIKSFHIEDMGGHTMALFGQFEDGRYFAGNEEGLSIYDIDTYPLYVSDDSENVDWEALQREHEKGTIEYGTKEFRDIMVKTKFFDESDFNEDNKFTESKETNKRDIVRGLLEMGAIDDPEYYNSLDEKGKEELIDQYMNDPEVLATIDESKTLVEDDEELELANDNTINKTVDERVEEAAEIGLDSLKRVAGAYKEVTLSGYIQDNKLYVNVSYFDNVTGETDSLGEYEFDRPNDLSDEDIENDPDLIEYLNLGSNWIDEDVEDDEELELEPRELDIEEPLEDEVGPTGDIANDINDANSETNTDLEPNEYTISDIINGVKMLIDSEKSSIAMYNEFLANFATKTPKDVYETIESYVNDIKDSKLDGQEKLNNLFDALNTYAKTDEPVERLNELVDEVPSEEVEIPEDSIIVANDEDDIFNSLAEEGKLVVTDFNTLTEEYAMYKGIENTNELKLEIKKSLVNKYKILEDKAYTFISKKLIENKLLEEEKKQEQIKELEKVKKEAEQNAKETGEDTYIYQSIADGTYFFATQKPTHTALFNKVLVIGKYKVSMERGEIFTTWLKESKQNYKYKKNLVEANLQDNKTIEDAYDSEAEKEIQKVAAKNQEGNIPDGKTVESPANPGDVITENKEVEVIEEIHTDYEKMTLDEFKKRNKEYIELVYKNTWGEGDIDKDLYDDIANTLYTDSITGNINTKSDYESLNDKIENAGVETIDDEKK